MSVMYIVFSQIVAAVAIGLFLISTVLLWLDRGR